MKKHTRFIILALLLVLLVSVGFLAFQNLKQRSDVVSSQEKIQDVTSQLDKLNTNLLELEEIFADKEMEVKQRNELLRQKYVQIGMLEEEVSRLKKQGNVDKKVIQEMEDKLAEARRRLNTLNFQEQQFIETKIEQQKRLIDSITTDAIAMRQQNEALKSQVLELGNGKVKPIIIDRPGDLLDLPDAVNFEYFNTADGNRRQGLSFQAKDTRQMEICFELRGDIRVNVDNYDLYMIITNPESGVVMGSASGSFKMDNVSKLYSAKKTIRFEGEKLKTCIPIVPQDKEFPKGINTVSIISKGKVIGTSTLEIK